MSALISVLIAVVGFALLIELITSTVEFAGVLAGHFSALDETCQYLLLIAYKDLG